MMPEYPEDAIEEFPTLGKGRAMAKGVRPLPPRGFTPYPPLGPFFFHYLCFRLFLLIVCQT